MKEYLTMSRNNQSVLSRSAHLLCKDWFDNDNQSGCLNGLHAFQNKSIEFIGNAYSQDVNYTDSDLSKYELITSHLHANPKDVCVINTGMHDQKKIASINKYTDYVRHYLTYLEKYCNKMIWLSINSVLNDEQHNQRNNVILEWNRSVVNMLRNHFPEVGYVDMFPMYMRRDMHQNNVHMNVTYYAEAARFFLQHL